MGKKISHKEFVQAVVEKYGNKFEVLSNYKTANDKVLVRCNECGSERAVTPASFLRQKTGCKKCYSNSKKHDFNSIDELIKNQRGDEYSLIDYFHHNNQVRITVKHMICGHVYTTSLVPFLGREQKCRKCNGTAKITNEEFNVWFKENMDGFSLKSPYISDRSKITVKHNSCGHVWEVEPRALKLGTRCPKCRRSHGERNIAKFLEEKNIEHIEQKKYSKCRNIFPLPFDFYLPEYDVLIEYQGIQHYQPVEIFGGVEGYKKTIENDKIKKKYCEDNQKTLYYIKYNEDIKTKLEKIIAIHANLEPS
ncbi:hypothetical protein [Staphylococcus phage PT94]